jgi:chaperonin cofactor prefoldin
MKKQSQEHTDTQGALDLFTERYRQVLISFDALEHISVTLLQQDLEYQFTEYPVALDKLRKIAAFNHKIYSAGSVLVKLIINAKMEEQELSQRIDDLEKEIKILNAEIKGKI